MIPVLGGEVEVGEQRFLPVFRQTGENGSPRGGSLILKIWIDLDRHLERAWTSLRLSATKMFCALASSRGRTNIGILQQACDIWQRRSRCYSWRFPIF
jgi:hypothetical protein